ncbi:hypothetical protein V6N13_128262 [Hibiscus sabdariffa]
MAYPSSPKLGLRIVGWARMNDPTDEQGRYGCSWGVHGWLVEAWGAGDCGCCWCAGKGPPEAAIHVKQQFT